jgi:ParB-like chromosome segregation protein Spo0J
MNDVMQKRLAKQPVSSVRWLHRDELMPNDYNPNRMMTPEMELLVLSIVEDGWTQPIVCLADLTIVDGFHRYSVSADPRIVKVTQGYVPVVIVNADPVHRKMSTIRHNRARGQHGILPMSSIVRSMYEAGVTKDDIMRRLGMEDEEVDRLLASSGAPTTHGEGFGKSWKPTRE